MTTPIAETVTIGTAAPDFSLPVGLGRHVTLSDLRGSIVVLVFYPGDWSPVCGDQWATMAPRRSEFDALGATLLGISVDGIFSHAAFADARGNGFDLLSDFEPKGAVARQYGVYRPEGFNRRALVVIDREGIVRWVQVIDRDGEPDRDPGADEILEAVREVASSW
ncbi:MAG: redoxin domain-containing protein [Chloroflexia bacterium]|nr:redoxin domain-containing protein [Chloroflexia bacterium]